MPVAVFLPEHDFLPHARLYLLVEVGIGEAQRQPVGPPLVRHADFAGRGLVVEAVVETFHAVDAVFVGAFRDAVVAEKGHVVVNVIVVVGEVLEGVHLVEPSVAQRLSGAQGGLVGVERAVGVGSVGEPLLPPLVGDDVHHAPDGIRAESHGHHAAVHLDALGEVHRQVVQVECRARPFLRHAVDEHFHVAAREAVKHELHVRTHASRLAELDPRHGGQGFRQVLVQSGHAFEVQCHGVEGRAVDAGHVAGLHLHLRQFDVSRPHPHVELLSFAGAERDGVFHRFISHGPDHQRVPSGFQAQVVDAPFIGARTCGRAFDLYGGEVHDFMVCGKYFSGNHGRVSFLPVYGGEECEEHQQDAPQSDYLFQCAQRFNAFTILFPAAKLRL